MLKYADLDVLHYLHYAAQYLCQFFSAVQLGGDSAETVFFLFCHNRVVGIAACYNSLYRWGYFEQSSYRLLSTHPAGYAEIEDDGIERGSRCLGAFKQFEPLP